VTSIIRTVLHACEDSISPILPAQP